MSRLWHENIDSHLGCQTIYLRINSMECIFPLSIFSKGGFRLGFIGFPIGVCISNRDSIELPRSLSRHVDLVRFPSSAFMHNPTFKESHVIGAPETAIVDLTHWRRENLKKRVRRDINRAERSGFEIRLGKSNSDAQFCYSLYEDTVKNHKGKLRYTESYFKNLVENLSPNAGMEIKILYSNNEPLSFSIVVDHLDTSYYLHGGVVRERARDCPSELLLFNAIQDSQQRGNRCFNLMQSPSSQTSLVDYKEKWGGETREHKTLDIAITPIRGNILRTFLHR